MASHNDTGKEGERIASDFLKAKGYTILEANWRHGRAEIDLIAKDGAVLVFIEVKTRATDRWGAPDAFVTPKKEQFMAEAASIYMEAIGHDWEIRFDIIAIVFSHHEPLITHYSDAFFPSWE